MTRSLPIEYRPGLPPAALNPDQVDLIRWVQQELYRVSESLIAQPVALTATDGPITIPIGDLPAIWSLLFPNVITPVWDVPGGSWNNPTTGLYTIPQFGLYQVGAEAEIAAFGAGNKTYYGAIRMTVTYANGDPDLVLTQTDGGADDVALGINFNIALPFSQGDILTFEISAVHTQFAGTVDYNAIITILRESG